MDEGRQDNIIIPYDEDILMDQQGVNVMDGAAIKEEVDGTETEMWSVEYSKTDMIMSGRIEGVEVKILIEQGAV